MRRIFVSIFIICLLVLSACSNNNTASSIRFPQLKKASSSYMEAVLSGEMVLKDGYLRIGDSLVIWQPDYFVHNNNGTIEILDRDGKMVAREGEEVYMGGGEIPLDYVNKILKEPLPPHCKGPYFLQGDGTRLSLNFKSELFGLTVVPFAEQKFCFLTAKPSLVTVITQKIEVTGKFAADYAGKSLRIPMIRSDLGSVENRRSVQYTPFWPPEYTARISDGLIEIVDGTGNIVARDGEQVTIEGRSLYEFNSIAMQLFHELPGGISGPYLIIDRIVR